MATRWYRQETAETDSTVVGLGYLRVSSAKQTRGMSPETQRHEIEAYIERQGWELGPLFSDTRQRWKTDRSGYLAMLEMVRTLRKAGRQVAVVAVAVDRTGSNQAQLHTVRDELQKLKVRMDFTREGGQVDDLTYSFKGMQAKLETSKMGERVHAAKLEVARRGLPPTGIAGWGYRWRLPVEEETEARLTMGAGAYIRRVLEEQPLESPSLQALFERVAHGETMTTILPWVAGLPEQARGGRKLGRTPIKQILRSALYIRRQVPAGSTLTPEEVLALPQGQWPRLIADETWLAVQQALNARSTTTRLPSGQYALTGYARCWRCGAKMTGDSNGIQTRYRCSGWAQGAGHAEQHCVTALHGARAEQAVYDEIGGLMAALHAHQEGAATALVHAWDAIRKPAASTATARLAALEQELQKLQNRVTKAQEAYFDGELTREERDVLVGKNRAALAQVRAEQARLMPTERAEPLLPEWEVVFERMDGWTAIRLERDGVPVVDEARAMLHDLVASVVVTPVTPGRKSEYRARVEWTPLGKALRKLA